MTFLMQLCRAIRPMKWLSKPFVKSVFYARARAARVYKVTKVQEFTGSKSHGIKIKNGGCYPTTLPERRIFSAFLGGDHLYITFFFYYLCSPAPCELLFRRNICTTVIFAACKCLSCNR